METEPSSKASKSDKSATPPCVSDDKSDEPVNEPLPMTATVKQEFPEDATPSTGDQSVSDSTMGYVRYYVQAALQALFGANIQAQVAAVAALPPNWGQPTEVGVQFNMTLTLFNCCLGIENIVKNRPTMRTSVYSKLMHVCLVYSYHVILKHDVFFWMGRVIMVFNSLALSAMFFAR